MSVVRKMNEIQWCCRLYSKRKKCSLIMICWDICKCSRSDSLRRHLESGICKQNEQSEDPFDETCETYLEQNSGMIIAEAERMAFGELK